MATMFGTCCCPLKKTLAALGVRAGHKTSKTELPNRTGDFGNSVFGISVFGSVFGNKLKKIRYSVSVFGMQ